MGTAHLNGPPAPPGADHWCVICLGVAKEKQWRACQAEVAAARDKPAGRVTFIAWRDTYGAAMRPADYTGICAEAPQLGPVPLCWDHIAGVDENPSPLANGGAVPPGLLRRKG